MGGARTTAPAIIRGPMPPVLPPVLPLGAAIVVWSYSGQVRPYRARAYTDGLYIGRTGFCSSEERAIEAATALLAKKAAR